MNLRSSIGLLIGFACSLVFTGTARAQPDPDVIHVEYWYHTGCTSPCAPTAYCEELYDSGQSIVIEVNSCTRRVNIWADDPDEHDIGRVLVERVTPGATLPSYLEIFIGQGDFPYTMQQSAAAARDLGDIAFANDNALRAVTRFAGHITGDLTAPTAVGRIYRLDVDGVLVGGLSAVSSPAAEQLFRVFAGSTVFSIIATSGTITSVNVTGTLGGSVSALDEGIVSIAAGTLRGAIEGGDFIGSVQVSGAIATGAGGPVLIKTYEPGAAIGSVQAASINANIEAGTSTSRGNVTRVQATSGNLAGSIKALNLTGTSSGVPGIEVSGSLSSAVTLASGGLQRQIIVNGANSGGSWTGGVTIGSTTLSGPYYSNTASSLGGGAVGLAPFQMHGANCVPPHDSAVGVSFTQAIISHYGPVEWDDSEGDKPFHAYYVELVNGQFPSNPTWIEISQDFDYALAENGRDVIVTAASNPGMDFGYGIGYLFEPVRDTSPPSGFARLECDGVTGSPVVGAYSYKFRVP